MAKEKRIDKLFKKEEKRLWNEWFTKKVKDSEDVLFNFYRPWAEDFYSKVVYRSDGMSYYEEFLPDVYIGLVKAIRDFKQNGAAFKTFASKCIRNEVINAWRPFFHKGKQRPGTFNFIGDILSDENFAIRDLHSYEANSEAKQIIRETASQLKAAIAGWGYTKREWKVFYYRVFRFMPIKDIRDKTKFSEWKVMITLAHIKKDILDEFGGEFKELLKGKYDD